MSDQAFFVGEKVTATQFADIYNGIVTNISATNGGCPPMYTVETTSKNGQPHKETINCSDKEMKAFPGGQEVTAIQIGNTYERTITNTQATNDGIPTMYEVMASSENSEPHMETMRCPATVMGAFYVGQKVTATQLGLVYEGIITNIQATNDGIPTMYEVMATSRNGYPHKDKVLCAEKEMEAA